MNYTKEYEDIYHPTNTSTLVIEPVVKKIKTTDEFIFKRKTLEGLKKIKCYKSLPNGRIRNAITGDYYEYKVGSKYEDLYFSCIMAYEKDMVLLFFLNPDDYEEHLLTTLPDEKKLDWYLKSIQNVK
jgi:hypothetical protein